MEEEINIFYEMHAGQAWVYIHDKFKYFFSRPNKIFAILSSTFSFFA